MESELDRLERRAQEVRGQLAQDLDELFLRVQPRRVVRNAGDYAREKVVVYGREAQTGRGLGRDIVRDMRRNPIPYLLLGIGVAGLVWAITSFSRTRTARRLPEFSEADFAPPASPRAAAVPPVAPSVAVGSAASTAASRPGSSPVSAPEREVSPVTSEER
jgi:hypothetical protein